jgi:hypothetical protein
MRERALIHVAGPAGAGKTAFIEALLAEGHALIVAARCRRDDSLHRPWETAPSAHPELRRYQQAGASGSALFAFPGHNVRFDDFFMTDLMTDYSQAVVLEGDNPLGSADLQVFVTPAPDSGERLFVRRARSRSGDRRQGVAVLERLLSDPGGVVDVLGMVGGAPLAELARHNPDLLDKMAATLHGSLAEAKKAPAPKAEKRWAIADRYAGIEQAQLVVVNARPGSNREAADQLVADVVRLRKDDQLFADILGSLGNRIPITAVVANLTDPADRGRKKALARTRRAIASILSERRE